MDPLLPGADFTTDWSSFERQLRGAAIELPHGLHSQPHAPAPHAGGARRGRARDLREKPLLGLTPGEIDRMIEAERSSGRRNVRTMQLRLHPEIVRLKQAVAEGRRTASTTSN